MILRRMIKNTKMFLLTTKMKTLSCVICSKYRKFEKPKILYILEKTLVLSIICNKNEDEKIFKKHESIEISRILRLIENISFFQKYG